MPAHSGDKTHHHDQLVTPVSLSTTSAAKRTGPRIPHEGQSLPHRRSRLIRLRDHPKSVLSRYRNDQHEIEIAANKHFSGRIRRVELLQHDDAPMIEPGQLMPRLVFADPPAAAKGSIPAGWPRRPGRSSWPSPPVLNQFRDHLLERWPEIRYIEVMTEDDSGQRTGGDVRFVEDGRVAADGEFTHVMVRLRTAELHIVDTLIAAGIANNRAEAIRWALTASPNAPPTSSCGEHTRDIERLKSEF